MGWQGNLVLSEKSTEYSSKLSIVWESQGNSEVKCCINPKLIDSTVKCIIVLPLLMSALISQDRVGGNEPNWLSNFLIY